MNNENNFSQNIEQPEQTPQTFLVTFDKNHFDGQELDQKTIDEADHNWLPELLNEWWKKICLENKPEVDDKNLAEAIYYLIEIARNAIEKVGSGEIKITFDKNTKNPLEQIKRHHGLYEVQGYADQMMIETNSKKYIKEPNTWGIALSQEATDISHGSRITFTKNYDQTVEEN